MAWGGTRFGADEGVEKKFHDVSEDDEDAGAVLGAEDGERTGDVTRGVDAECGSVWWEEEDEEEEDEEEEQDEWEEEEEEEEEEGVGEGEMALGLDCVLLKWSHLMRRNSVLSGSIVSTGSRGPRVTTRGGGLDGGKFGEGDDAEAGR